MSIPENDNQLWKGFDGHGLYAKRTERDRDGVIIDEAYARKSELHPLENALSDSTTTELTPAAAKSAIDGILKAPTPGAEGTMLSYGVSQNAMAWDSWESGEIIVPEKLPQNCVLLDYFTEGYRLGIEPDPESGSFASVSQEAIAALDYSSIFPNGMPVAVFNKSTATPTMNYDLSRAITLTDGYTIEFWAKTSATEMKWLSMFLTKCNGSTDWRSLYYVWYQFGGFWRNSSGSTQYEIYQTKNTTTEATAWHHFALTRTYNHLYYFVNGECTHNKVSYDYGVDKAELILSLYQCVGDVNKSMAKFCDYRMAQLAVWNYPRYTTAFTPSSKLIVDPTFE